MALGLIKWLEQQWILASFSNHPLSLIFFSIVLPFFLIVFFFVVVRSFSYKQSRTYKKEYNLPPSPLIKLPIIGNLHQIVSSSSLPHHSLHSLSKKYGPLMFLHFGQVPTLVVSSAAMAQEIMKTHDLACSNRPDLSIPKRLTYDKDVAFAPYGEYWRQMRRICALQLLSPKRVQSYRSVREEEISLIIEKIKKGNSSSSFSSFTSVSVDLSKMVTLLTNDIICRIALGRKYSGEEGGKRYKEMILEFLELLGVIDVGGFIPWLAWFNSFNGLNSRIEKNFRELDSFLERVIEDHMYKRKNKEKSECDDKEEEDFVDVLLDIEGDCTIGLPFSKDNIKAIVLVSLLFSKPETQREMDEGLKWLQQKWTSTSSFIFFSFLLPFFILLVFFKLFISRKQSKTSKYYNLPPSPSKLPIIGNLHQVGSQPHHSLYFLSLKHGPLMFLHLGQVPFLIVSSASMAQEIMKTHDLACSSRPESRIAKRLLYGKDVAAVPYGEYWRQVRKICILQLLSPKRVQSYRSVREEEIALMIENIRRHSCSSSSSMSDSVDLSKTLALLTNDIICRVALGKKYRGEESGERYKKMIEEFLALLGYIDIGEMIPSLCWVSYLNGLNTRIEKNFEEIDSFLEQVIEDHIERRKKMRGNGGDDGEVKEDFADVLLGIEEDCNLGVPFSKDNIKALILDMFSAGTDTTYTVIEWTMAELMRHPEVMKEVQKEVRNITKSGQSKITEDNIQQMPYLRSVIKETFRLHPPIPLLVPRETTEDIKIDGYDIPAKTRIIVNAWAIGRDSESWNEPEKFRPERFLNEGSSIDFKGHDFQLIPFGAGRRGCPGIYLAMATVELALANLLNEFNWEMPNGERNEDLDMVEGTGLTIHKKSPLVLKARPHNFDS